MKHIILVPTSHISSESIKLVKKIIKKEKPDCVAVELDMSRFVMMESGETSNRKAIRQLGPWTFAVFYLMKLIQTRIGSKVGIFPGSDMLSAVREAEKAGIHVEFIDRHIGVTLQRIQAVSWKEKAKMVLFMVKGLTLDSLLSRIGRAKIIQFDPNKVPPKELILEILGILEREFPGLHMALVKERDVYMARRLAGLTQRYEKIVAVVGAGHAPGMQRLLSKENHQES